MIRFFALPVALLVTMPAAAAAPAEPAATPASRVLSAVACQRVSSCWAVGSQTASGVTRTLIEHWNGRKWSLTASPSVAGSKETLLTGVSCAGRLKCMAVGGAALGSARQEPIAERWNGRKWSLSVLPEPAGLAADDLIAVWCPGATRCWAVGTAARQVSAARVRPLAEHWTGKKWSVISTRAAGSFSNLIGVYCRSDTDCFAVGGGSPVNALAEHWNGRRWSATTPFTGGGLAAVWCTGTDCFATGNSGYPSAVASRWNGRKWSLTPTAGLLPGAVSALPGVSCVTSADCFAVGIENNQTLIEHWQGSKWMKARNPNPAGAASAALRSVFCLSARACWAVGTKQFTVPDRTLAEYWNGRHWSIARTP